MDEITIRGSSWPELFDCPARWVAKHREGRSSWTSPESLIGTAVHAGSAVFDKARAQGAAIHPEDAVDVVEEAVRAGSAEVPWSAGAGEWTPRAVSRDAVDTYLRYSFAALELPPWEDVEFRLAPLRFEFPEVGVAITITGTGDRRRRTATGYRVADLKTGRGFRAGANVSQVGAYAVATSAETGKPADGELLHATMKGVTAYAIPFAAAAMLGDDETPGLIETAARMLGSGAMYGNPRSMLCSGKFCPVYQSCRYRGGLEQ